MSRFPVIDTPCPFRAERMPEPGRDHCGHCDRTVHNLDGMSRERREAFLSGCSGKVCVAYTVHRSATRRNAALGAGLAALAGSGAAFAQEAPAPANPIDVASVEQSTVLTAEQIEKIPVPRGQYVLMGGVLDGKSTRWADESDLAGDAAEPLPEIDALEWLPSQPEP